MRRALLSLALVLVAATANATVTGRVMDPDGKPLAGARIRAFPLETQQALYARVLSATPERAPLSTIETKADGGFLIDAKGHAVVRLVVDAPDRDWRWLDAVDGEDAGVFVLRPVKKMRGRVTAAGKGVANALVVLTSDVFVRTGADGTYEFAPANEQEGSGLFVIHPDYAPAEGFGSSRNWASRYDVELRTGTAMSGRVLASDGRTPVAGATIRAGGWPLARSAEDGTFHVAHAPQTQTLTAVEGTRIGTAQIDRKKTAYDIVLRPGASLSGMVRNAKDGRPVAGARVVIEPPLMRSEYTAITDAKGNFSIAPMPPMSAFAQVQHPAYALTPPPPVDVAEGARLSQTFDAMPLARLRGTVVDEQRRPVPAARVGVLARAVSVTTGADGTFSIRAPHSSEPLSVTVSKNGFATTTEGPIALRAGETKTVQLTLRKGFRFEITLLDAEGKPLAGEPISIVRWLDPTEQRHMVHITCTDADAAACITTGEKGSRVYDILEGRYDIIAGGTTTVSKRLTGQTIDARTPPLTIRLDRGYAVAGRVVDADDKPVEGAFITTSTRGISPRTDAAGAFSISSLTEGASVTLTAQTQEGLFSDPVTATAPAADVVLRFPRPARIEGRVFDRDSKAPLRDFTIAVSRDRRVAGPNAPRKFTPDDGRFALDAVSPGELDLVVQAKGYVAGGMVDVKATAGGTTNVEIALDRGAIVKGRVTSSGQPLGDVTVMVQLQGGPVTRTMQPQRPVRTDASGEFVLEGVTPGGQRVDFRKQGYVQTSKTVDVTAGQDTRLDVELARGRELRGRVVDEGGRPIVNAEIVIRNLAAGMIRSDTDGAFTLDGLGDETYVVIARKDGYVNDDQEVTAQTSSVTLTLGRGATITGRVTGVEPAEITNVEVMATDYSNWRSPARPDTSGNFTIHGVPDGKINVRASLPRPVRREAEPKMIDVVNAAAPFVQLDFSAGIVVRGRVTRNGAPVEGTLSFMRARTGPAPRPMTNSWAEIGPGGTYEMRVSEPGDYDIRVNVLGDTRGVGATSKVTVTGPMTHDIDVRGATLRGRVIDETTGEPLAGARIDLSGPNNRVVGPPVQTDSAGRFSINGVSDETYRLVATRDRYVSDPVEVVVSGGDPREVELRVRQAIAIGVRVTDAGDNSLIDASISPRLKGSNAPPTSRPAPRVEGGAQRLWLLPGTYTVAVWAEGYSPKTIEVTVPGPDVSVALERGGRIIITGLTPGAVMVRLRAPASTVRMAPATQAQFQNLAPGVYTLEALDAERKVIATREDVRVVAGQTTTVTLP
jgi:Carboxypeptidase regulatory-like domain